MVRRSGLKAKIPYIEYIRRFYVEKGIGKVKLYIERSRGRIRVKD
jgi:hypothetical protein